jgi:uncharacterized membrane protein
VAALAYLFPPLSGLVAYLGAASGRVRWHGLQAVLLGVVWPAALYGGAALSPRWAQAAGLGGAVLWLVFLVGTAAGRDPRWPVLGAWLRQLAASSPKAGSGGADLDAAPPRAKGFGG